MHRVRKVSVPDSTDPERDGRRRRTLQGNRDAARGGTVQGHEGRQQVKSCSNCKTRRRHQCTRIDLES